MSGMGNETQARIIAEQVAEAAIVKFHQQYPAPTVKSEIPPPLKWAAGIIASLMATGIAALCFWVVSTLSDLQQTVTRIDERQQLTGPSVAGRLDKIEERMTRLEHQQIQKGATE